MRVSIDFNRKDNKRNLVFLFVIIIILLLSFFYIYFIRTIPNENAYNNITELSEQTTAQLNMAIQNQMKFVEIVVDFINKGYPETK